jgi:transcriptional regulator with XRE-family HTH domain
MPSLREMRVRRPMTIRELAAAASVTPKTIVAIEAGRSRPRPGTMRRIAAALDAEPSQITEFADAMTDALSDQRRNEGPRSHE